MKTNVLFFLSLIIIVLSSCSKDDDNSRSEMTTVIGQWKLIEQLADPGDGSGTFKTIENEKILKFSDDGVVTAYNGSLCEPYSDQQIASGTYDKMGIRTNCDNVNISYIGLEMKDGFLILHFASNEGFSQKFESIGLK